MSKKKLNNNEKLDEKSKPSIYLNAPFVLQYLYAEGEDHRDENGNEAPDIPSPPYNLRDKLMQDLLETKNRAEHLAKIKNIAKNSLSDCRLVFTPTVLIEVIKSYAERSFKELITDNLCIGEAPENHIGRSLSRLFVQHLKNKKDKLAKGLLGQCSIGTSLTREYGLKGITYLNDLSLHINSADIDQFLQALALQQLSASEILNLHAAKSIGCKYFATLEQGFVENKKFIYESIGLKVLGSAEEILKVLNKHRKNGVSQLL